MRSMLVTGAANGIGRAIAEAADRAGYRVGVLDLSLKDAESVAASLTHGVALSCDVTAADQVNQVLDAQSNINVNCQVQVLSNNEEQS